MANRGWKVWALLAVLLAAFCFSDRYFSILEDEVSIATVAHTAPGDTIGLFLSGQGQHEHPPLSDLLLHHWLPVGDRSPMLLRLPFVVCYLGGLLLTALAAGRLGGNAAFRAALGVGALWPFGFHFGRLCGWYAVTFLLVAHNLATVRYLATNVAVMYLGQIVETAPTETAA